jgi:hypothetical protein
MSKLQFSEARIFINTFGEANSQQLFIGEIIGYITFW